MDIYRKTPIMGWASWNCFRTDISEQKIKTQIDALVSLGLADCGYTYCNLDDGFFGGRDENGYVQFHKNRFPNGIKVIADYAHSKGLKAGVYAEGGDTTCGFYYDNEGTDGYNVGLCGFEEQDIKMYLEDLGFDFIKVDWCGGLRLALDEQEQYTKIGKIIDKFRHKLNKPIIYNICRWQFPGEWVTNIADSWRTGADIAPNFDSLMHQLDVIKPLRRFCSPGHVNDLDMMQLGNGMSNVEEKTHFAMWCMMSTPLIIGCDLTKISSDTLEILKNKELIEINQDKACLQAYVVKEYSNKHRNINGQVLNKSGNSQISGEVWIKDLGQPNSNKKAVAFLNRLDCKLSMSVYLQDLGLDGAVISARDLQKHEDVELDKYISVKLAPHETIVYKIECERAVPVRDINEVSERDSTHINKIDLETAEALVDAGAYLVDVRDAADYERGHLKNAINLPYTEVHAMATSLLPEKNCGVIVYCKTGKRSSQALSSLEYLGYKFLYFLGGIDV